jgi:hypothetical protein
VGDYSNKHYIKSGDTQFTGEKLENSVESADTVNGESWRRTEVQWYSSTVVQIYVAIERMVAVGFRKRDPSLNY